LQHALDNPACKADAVSVYGLKPFVPVARLQKDVRVKHRRIAGEKLGVVRLSVAGNVERSNIWQLVDFAQNSNDAAARWTIMQEAFARAGVVTGELIDHAV
jgi:hypothetical protein